MAFKWKRKALMAKSEATYGVDPTPVAGTNAILARNVSLSPLKQEYDDRQMLKTFYGNDGKLVAGSWVEIDFEVEMAGAGAAGGVPGYGPLLKACGMSETNVPATSETFAPISAAEVSCTIYFYMDGRLHKITGAFGNVEVVLMKGRAPYFAFKFLGLYTIPSDTALITPTLTGYQKPLAVTNANTTPLTLFTFSGKFSEVRFSTGNALAYRNLVGSEAIRFTDRKSVGSVKLEDELVATKDWWTIVRAGTTGALAVTHGTVAGNKVSLAAPAIQLTDPSMSEEDGIAMISMSMELLPTAAGNDEWSIVVL